MLNESSFMYHRFPVIIHSCIRESMKVTQSCPTLCDQARIPEWVAFPFSMGSSQPRDWIQVSCIAVYLPAEPQGKPKNTGVGSLSHLQGNLPTQELNRGLLRCRQILYQPSYQGSSTLNISYLYFFENKLKTIYLNQQRLTV